MSRFVVKVGGGHPDRHVVKKFFARVDKDPLGWYPGKAAVGVGRPVELTGAAAKKICNSMMAAKHRKLEPSYDLACALDWMDVRMNRCTAGGWMYGVIQKWSMADGQASEREDGWTCGLTEARTELRQMRSSRRTRGWMD